MLLTIFIYGVNWNEWDNWAYLACFAAIFFGCTAFINREKIRDHMQEIGAEVISINYFGQKRYYGWGRSYATIYSVTYKDIHGRTLNAKCDISWWSDVDLYDGTVMEDPAAKAKKH